MTTLLAVVAVPAVLGCAVLAVAWWRLRQRVDQLRIELGDGIPDDWEAAPVTAREVVVVVNNTLELATKENRMAGMLNRVAPSMLDRIVHDEVARQLRERLVEEGVEADVRVRRRL